MKIETMKQVKSSAFIWSTEDLDMNLERLFESDNITKEQYDTISQSSIEDRHILLDSIIEGIEEYLMEHINELITNGLYDHIKSTNQ
jgi:hypothetical protein